MTVPLRLVKAPLDEPPGPDEIFGDEREHNRRLALLLIPYWRRVFEASVRATAKLLDKPVSEISVTESMVERYLERAATQVKLVNGTTREAVAQLLQEGVRRGLSASEIAAGTEDFPGLRHLFDETMTGRSEMIARTEISTARLAAQREVYPAAGIERVVLSDGTEDPCCAPRDGAVVRSTEIPELCHPNCVLSASPATPRNASP